MVYGPAVSCKENRWKNRKKSNQAKQTEFEQEQGVKCIEFGGFPYPKPKYQAKYEGEDGTQTINCIHLCQVISIFIFNHGFDPHVFDD